MYKLIRVYSIYPDVISEASVPAEAIIDIVKIHGAIFYEVIQ